MKMLGFDNCYIIIKNNFIFCLQFKWRNGQNNLKRKRKENYLSLLAQTVSKPCFVYIDTFKLKIPYKLQNQS